MTTSVRLATPAQIDVVRNVDQYYLYEFAKFMPEYYKLGDDGLFHDEDYSSYWEENGKFPYLIFSGEEIAGFALVEEKSNETVLAQFFVMYKFQGLGIARSAALDVFRSHSAPWIVHSLIDNPKSEGFWPKVIGEYSPDKCTVEVQEPKRTHHVYRFGKK